MAPTAPRPTPHQDALLDRTGIISASSRGSTVPPRPGINRSGAAGFMAFVLMVLAGVTGLSEVDGGGGASTLIAGDDVSSQAPVPDVAPPGGSRPDSPSDGQERPRQPSGDVAGPPAPVTPAPSVPQEVPTVDTPEPVTSPPAPAGPVRAVAAEADVAEANAAAEGAESALGGAARSGGVSRAGVASPPRSPADAADRVRTDVEAATDAAMRDLRHRLRTTLLQQQPAMVTERAAQPHRPEVEVRHAPQPPADVRDAHRDAHRHVDVESHHRQVPQQGTAPVPRSSFHEESESSEAPESHAPESPAPEAHAPETPAPETHAPETHVPQAMREFEDRAQEFGDHGDGGAEHGLEGRFEGRLDDGHDPSVPGGGFGPYLATR